MKKAYEKPTLGKRERLSAVTAACPPSQCAVSDIRLKEDIVRVGAASNGLPLYRFRYLGERTIYEGVMAQDVQRLYPDAVVTMPYGFLAVNYGRLGIEMKRVH